jgi:hypothetical protein
MNARCASLVALPLLVLALTGCGGSTARPDSASPSRPADSTPEPAAPAPASSSAEVARAYVDAINAHDGATVCGLMLDSAAYEFRIAGAGECPLIVSTYIGYGEESDTDTFHRARILDLTDGERKGALRSLHLSLEVEVNEQGNEANRRKATFDDVLWLVERDGRWRLAKASGLLYASFAAYQVPDDLFEAPDLARQERAYERATAKEREQEASEEASYRPLGGQVFHCEGATTSYEDPSHDVHIEGDRDLSRAEAEAYGAADVRRVEVDTEGDDLCVRVTLRAIEIERRLVIGFRIYSPKRNATYLGPQTAVFLDVRSDGRARLTPDYRDDWGNTDPVILVPGALGRNGTTFSFRVARGDLLALMGDRAPQLPSWEAFLWGVIDFYRVDLGGAPRAISDDVPAYYGMVGHPGGRIFDAHARQERDLPTGSS